MVLGNIGNLANFHSYIMKTMKRKIQMIRGASTWEVP